MNNKGFTLIELIAMVVILGILMLVSVPNIAGIIKNNKEKAVAEDVSRLVNNAKTKFNIKAAKYPSDNACVVLGLDFIDTNGDIGKGINGGKYLPGESFIVVRKEMNDKTPDDQSTTYSYKYYVRLVEEADGEKYEIELVNADLFYKEPRKYLKNLAPTVTADLKNADETQMNNTINQLGLACGGVTNIYS